MQEYFNEIEDQVKDVYDIAVKAKQNSSDPKNNVEIPLAKNMAERVEGLVSAIAPQILNTGIPNRITELEKRYGKLDWRVALTIALEVTQEKFCKFKDKREAMEVGIRVGFAYITVGVVASPLEGFVRLQLKKRKDGEEYFCLYYSGPVRSAGGTGASVSVLIADYIRKKMGYSVYDPTDLEIKRAHTELTDYHEKVTNLQYLPSEEEVNFLIENLPIQIDGDPSEKYDVSNYKDLERIEANRIRNGFCLVVAECLCQKAPKLLKQLSKWGKDFELEDWDFLDKFVRLQKRMKAREKTLEEASGEKLKPDYVFIKDLVGGRPIITHPLRTGGLRLRYGRSRTSGLSSMSIHPATMIILNNYIGTGTQLKYERPGKSTAVAPCDNIEGPIVKLKNGKVQFLDTEEEARTVKDQIKEIIFLGDILINHGEFLNRAHFLVPCGYCEEWWTQELINNKDYEEGLIELGLNKNFIKELIQNPVKNKINIDIAYKISKSLNIPLHSRYTIHWKDISKEQFFSLINLLKLAEINKDKSIIRIPYQENEKRTLELIGLPHGLIQNNIVIEDDWAKAFMISLDFFEKELDLDLLLKIKSFDGDVLDFINTVSKIKLRDKSGTFIGARMGRPEKAKLRKLTGIPHILFPVGDEGGRLRSFQAAMEFGSIKREFPIYYCKKCKKETIYPICESCGDRSEKKYYCKSCNLILEKENCPKHGKCTSFKDQKLDIKYYMNRALKKSGLDQLPELIKGVRGTSNEDHTPENLIKGILRAVHNLYVNKDGTIRYDMTEMPITHFRPNEIGTSIKRLRELGYEQDIYGNKIENDEQLIEIKPQDVILPACTESDEEGADIVLFRITQFIDDLLELYYGQKRFYNLKSKQGLVGHFVIGLAPHTSAGIIGRIIGFSKTQGCFASPLWHSAQRRDCEGDENCIILLLDVLLNFSRKYLPAHRGSTQDAPLVLTTILTASEVDDMVFDMDIVWNYPLEFYEACQEYKPAYEIKLEKIGDRLGTEKEYYEFGFTHDTKNINQGVRVSAYKFLPTMMDKVRGQMELAEKIRAVDESDVARLIIERHFIRDIKGNLRKFSMQQFRCVKCNEKYRRPPLVGYCLKCGGNLIFTISEGSIIKYLEPSLELSRRYKLPPYLNQTLELTKKRIESVFGKEKEKQEGLVKWFA